MNAYATPELAAAHAKLLDDHKDEIAALRSVIANPGSNMEACNLAFDRLLALHEGDEYMLRRLLVNREYTAKRHAA